MFQNHHECNCSEERHQVTQGTISKRLHLIVKLILSEVEKHFRQKLIR